MRLSDRCRRWKPSSMNDALPFESPPLGVFPLLKDRYKGQSLPSVERSCSYHSTDIPLETATNHARSLRRRTLCRQARPLRWPSRRARVQDLNYRLLRNLKRLFHLVMIATLNVATVALGRELICGLHNRVEETINRFESRTRINEDQSLETKMPQQRP